MSPSVVQQRRPRRVLLVSRERVEHVAREAEQCAEHQQRVQPNEPDARELRHAHAWPAVVVCVADDEAREREEEVHRERRVVKQDASPLEEDGDPLDVEEDDEERRAAAQSVEDLEARLATGRRLWPLVPIRRGRGLRCSARGELGGGGGTVMRLRACRG